MRKITIGLAAAISLIGIFLFFVNAAQGGTTMTLKQAMELDKQDRHDEAVEAINKIISQGLESEKSKAYLSLGLVYFKSGGYDDALLNFSRSVEINNSNPMAYYFMGMIYEKKALGTPNAQKAKEMKTEALKAWQNYLRTVDASKERPEAHGNLGITVKESIRRAQKHIEILEEGLRNE